MMPCIHLTLTHIMRALTVAAAGLAMTVFGDGLSPATATPALVVDLDNQNILYEKDAGRPWFPASTTKLMTALVTYKALQAGEVDLDTPVILSRRATSQSFANSGLKAGQAMTLWDALHAVLVGSANDVAVALAETVAGTEEEFVTRMNEEAKKLGLSASHFANPNGLANPDQQVTARDLAVLGRELYKNHPDFHPIYRTSRVVIDTKAVESFNILLTEYPGTLGLKTGFLCSSGRNLVALAEKDDRRILVVLLGATTGRERSERAAKLFTEAFDGTLKPTGQRVADLQNDLAAEPPDMRMKLCSDQTAAYETRREALYPMGLPGQKSYLSPPISPVTHTINTWKMPGDYDVPVPTTKPALASVKQYVAANAEGWNGVRPPRKPVIGAAAPGGAAPGPTL